MNNLPRRVALLLFSCAFAFAACAPMPTVAPSATAVNAITPRPTEPVTRLPASTIAIPQPSPSPIPTRFSAAELQATALASDPFRYTALWVQGSQAYIGYGQELLILDISEPRMPSELGRIKLAGRITSIQVANNTAYVGLREQWNYDYSEFLPWDTGGLQIVDVSTPTLPTSIGLYYGGSTTAAVVVDTYAYVYVRGSESMEVVDIADAAYPKRISFVHGVVPRGFGRTEITSITVVGDYAYLASWLCHRSCTGDVYTMSLAEPSQPVVIGRGNRRWSSLGGFSDIIVVDHYAYVVQSSLLVIYDIFDPTQLIWLEHRNFLESDDSYRIGRKLVRADEHVYVTAYTGLLILDISDAANPTKVGFYEEVQDLWEIAIVDSYAYVIRREGGLYVLDISSPRAPVLVGHYQVMQP